LEGQKKGYDSIESFLEDAEAVIKNIAIKKHKPQLLATFQAIKTPWSFSGLFLVFCCWIEASAM